MQDHARGELAVGGDKARMDGFESPAEFVPLRGGFELDQIDREHRGVDVNRPRATHAALMVAGDTRDVVEDGTQAVASWIDRLAGSELSFKERFAVGNYSR